MDRSPFGWDFPAANRSVAIVFAASLALLPTPATAQTTTLPGIVVTTPSPIAKAPAPTPAPTKAPAPATTLPETPPPTAFDRGIGIVTDDVFVPVTVVTGSDLLGRPGATLGDTLYTSPGITGSTFAPGASRPIIRGLDNNRVRIQENGIGAHDVSALSEDHGVPIDPLTADRIEVVRGPATLRYGSQAIGGVVSAESGRIPTAIPPAGWRAMTRGGYNSVNSGVDGILMVEAGAGPFAVHADTFRRSAEDYRTPHGRQLNSSLEAEGEAIGASFILPSGFIGVAYSSYASLYHIPGVDAAADNLRIGLEQHKIMSRGELRVRDFGIEAIRFWLGRTRYRHDEITGTNGLAEIGSTFINNQTEARVEMQHMPFLSGIGRITGAAGFQWGARDLSAGGEGGELLAPNQTRSFAGFIFEELQLTRKLRLQAAARLEHVEIRGSTVAFPAGHLPPPDDPDPLDVQRSFMPASASAGILYDLPMGVVARLTAQYVERAPDAGELLSKGPHEATRTFEIGDPNLGKERARAVEIGFRRAKGQFRFDVTGFRTEFNGFIFKRLTGVKCDDDFASCGTGAELDQIVYGQRNATFTGAEVQGELDIAPIWRGVWGIDGRYDFVDAKFEEGGNVPRIAPHRAGAGIYYRAAGLFVRTGFLHAFRQDRIADNETPTSGYTLVSAEISHTWNINSTPGMITDFTLGVRGDNLLDDDVRNHVSFKKDEVLLEGRSVRVFGTLKFN